MAQVIVRITGQQQTVKNLSAFDMRKQKEARVVVKKHATAIRKTAKNTVPVSPSERKKSSGSPGDLKRSIRSKYYFNGLGAMVLPAKPKGSHRGIVEYGTKQRSTKKGANRGKVTGKPFMEPAKRAQEASYNLDMKRVFDGPDEII